MKSFDFNLGASAQKSPFFLPALVIMIIGVVILGFFQVPAYEKKEVSQPVAEAVIEAFFDYEVKAGADTMLWSAGEIMEQGMPLYFIAVDPLLTVSITLEAEELDFNGGSVHLDFYLESVDRDNRAFWSEHLKSYNAEITKSDRSIDTMAFKINDIYELAKEINTDLEFRKGSHRLLIVMEAQLGEEKMEHSLAFNLENEGVVPPSEDKLSSKREVYGEIVQKIMVARTFNDYMRCGYFWIYAVTIIVLIVIAFVSYNTEQKTEYQRYKNYISKVDLTMDREPDAYFYSLKELIEMAVELDKKVIFDETRDTYYILDGDKVYAHKKDENDNIIKPEKEKG